MASGKLHSTVAFAMGCGDASHAIAFLAAWASAEEEEEPAQPGYVTVRQPAQYGLFVKCCFRRASALVELYREDDAAARWSLRRALTDLAACLYSDENSAQFAALLERVQSLEGDD